MSKSVLFFSHSSKDKDIIIPIKEKINSITGNTFDIFMSSDGQSIPFGRNWVHKIEEGLAKAKIMFVFITENSLLSGWIYFESGFAYSKGIQVIPVGIGVDIGSLKPPLNLLQGFNITSVDSLNNFTSIINSTFKTSFSEKFVEDDYETINRFALKENNNYGQRLIQEIICKAEFDIFPEHTDQEGNVHSFDVDESFKRIVEYLDSISAVYSSYKKNKRIEIIDSIIYAGIRIDYQHKHRINSPKDTDSVINHKYSTIRFGVSLYNFDRSFAELNSIINASNYDCRYIRLSLDSDYYCLSSKEDISSILFENDVFTVSNNNPNKLLYGDSDISVNIGIGSSDGLNNNSSKIISIVYSNSVSIKDIYDVIERLYEIGIIFKISDF